MIFFCLHLFLNLFSQLVGNVYDFSVMSIIEINNRFHKSVLSHSPTFFQLEFISERIESIKFSHDDTVNVFDLNISYEYAILKEQIISKYIKKDK